MEAPAYISLSSWFDLNETGVDKCQELRVMLFWWNVCCVVRQQVDIHDKKDVIELKADVPGLSKDDIKVPAFHLSDKANWPPTRMKGR